MAIKNSREMALLPYSTARAVSGRESAAYEAHPPQDVGLGDSGDVVVPSGRLRATTLSPRARRSPGRRAPRSRSTRFAARAPRAIRSLDHAKEVAGELEALDVTLAARAHDGKLFGSITEKDVADAIRLPVGR